MVIVQIKGGLGNQMFQYAAGRALAERTRKKLKFDLAFFDKPDKRSFELGFFDLEFNVASLRELDFYSGERFPLLGRFSNRILGRNIFINPYLYKEPFFHFDEKFLSINKNVYLSGYWQSERYFSEIANTIRSDFMFKYPMNIVNTELAKKIQSVTAVSLHVRRGDYAKNPETLEYHGLTPEVYYKSAIKYILSNAKNPHFFVFSDDIEWARNNLEIAQPCIFVDHNNGLESVNDMRLMSMCSHNIIANSSFSWWGAWLNPNINKIVIAPNRWFNKANIDTRDLYCPRWVIL